MTFHQFAASSASHLPTSARLALEDVWNVMIGAGVSSGEASRLLSDLLESIPEATQDHDEDEWL